MSIKRVHTCTQQHYLLFKDMLILKDIQQTHQSGCLSGKGEWNGNWKVGAKGEDKTSKEPTQTNRYNELRTLFS